MNKHAKRITAAGLCAALCLCGAGVAFAQTGSEQKDTYDAPAAARTATQSEEQQAVKDETVYVFAGADGGVQKIIVSDWLQNTLGGNSLSDRTSLSDIENVKGDESFTADSDGGAVWDAQGGDIYYQGTIEKELPVGLSITYTLDGQPIAPQELAGKSGHVTIRFDYENRQYEMVEIDGKTEKIYVPFAVLTGMFLDNDVFRNVEISSGKLVNDGEHTVAAGLAFPGLREDLGLTREQLDIPDHVEITADVTGFELGVTMTAVTGEVFRDLDAEKLDSLDASGSLTQLTDAMEQLLDGSDALYDGLCQLLDQSGRLTDSVGQLAAGAETLKTGAAQLDAGLGELSNGLSALSANSAQLNGGAEQVFTSLLASASTQLRATGLDVPDLTADNYAQVLSGILASLGEDTPGGQTVAALKASLDSYNAFYQGLCAYTDGVDSAAAGAGALVSGSGALKDGARQLSDGMQTMQNSLPALTQAVTALRDGSGELAEGLRQFNEQGVQKLAARLRATVDAAKAYQSFSGLSEDMTGQVRFIYRTDEIRQGE